MTNLLENQMFLQFLNALGQDISAGEGTFGNLGGAVQQNISAQNFAQILQQMLGGGLGEGDKLSFDQKGVHMDLAMSGMMAGDMGGGKALPMQGAAPQQQPTSQFAGPSYQQRMNTNPFASSQQGISAANLAGLTPEQISMAMHHRQAQENIGDQSIRTMTDTMYKQALTEQIYHQMSAVPPSDPLDQQFPVTFRGEPISLRQWKELPRNEQEYSIYEHHMSESGETPMSRREFNMMQPTEREKLLRALDRDQRLLDIETQLGEAKSMKLSLGQEIERKQAFSQLQGMDYFNDPRQVRNDLERFRDTDAYMIGKHNSEDPQSFDDEQTVKFFRRGIESGQGKIISERFEEGKIIFEVQWPHGRGIVEWRL